MFCIEKSIVSKKVLYRKSIVSKKYCIEKVLYGIVKLSTIIFKKSYNLLITSPTPIQISYFVPIPIDVHARLIIYCWFFILLGSHITTCKACHQIRNTSSASVPATCTVAATPANPRVPSRPRVRVRVRADPVTSMTTRAEESADDGMDPRSQTTIDSVSIPCQFRFSIFDRHHIFYHRFWPLCCCWLIRPIQNDAKKLKS